MGVVDLRAVWREESRVKMIDQRLLPEKLVILEMTDFREIAEAISNMTVRGAPSIGAAAAYGMMLAAVRGEGLERAGSALRSSRPTAHDLFYAVEFMERQIGEGTDPSGAADRYADSIVERCLAIGRHGASLIREGFTVMTHCNAGALAAVDIGTALAPMRVAWGEGRHFLVYVSETRPRLQGMRLTAWELLNEGIPHKIIVDSASAHFMRQDVDVVLTGADRITANGDFANKIGTLEKAVLAREFGIPFYVAAPVSTFDLSLESGEDIPIECRDEEEVTCIDGMRLAPEGSEALNPAFDVTPGKLVSGFITERGIIRPDEVQKMRGGIDAR